MRLAAFVAAFAMLLFFCVQNIRSYDYWWHAASGRWILDNGIMHADPFSFTAEGTPLVDPYWLAQIVLYLLGGAVVIFKAVVIIAAFAFSILAAPRQMRVTVPAAALVFLGIFVGLERFLCRPEIFTLLFTSLTLWILFSLAEHRRFMVFALVPLTALWANMHPGWVMAPLLLAACGGGRLLGRRLGFSARSEAGLAELRMLAAAGLCVIAALANPYFVELVVYPFRLAFLTPHEIGSFLEWVSPVSRLSSGVFSFELIHFKILVLLLTGSFALNYRRFDFGHAAIAVLALMLALTSYRHFAIFTLVSIPIILTNVKPFWQDRVVPLIGKKKPKLAHLAAAVAVIAACAYYCEEAATNRYYAKRELYNMSFGIGISETSFPTSALSRSVTEDGETRFFNSYELGGYITHKGYPRCQVFLDGRLVHYPKEVYDDYLRVQANPELWDSLVNKYDIHCVIIIHNLPRMQGLLKHIHNNPRWHLSRPHLNGVTAIYCRRDLNILFSPEEWREAAWNYPVFRMLSIARFYVNVGEYQEASELLSGLAGLNPGNGNVYLYYGLALAGTGKLQEARAAFQKAAELLPDSAEAHLNLGVAYSKLGEKEKARRECERVLEIEPRNEQALEYLKGIDGNGVRK